MSKTWRGRVREDVENEGFDYAFTHYSNYEEVKDEQFHKLRLAYAEARAALVDYIGLEDV